MRTIIVLLFTVAALFSGCNTDKNQKKNKDHDSHEHPMNDPHDHSTENIHTHEAEAEQDHTDEIYFSILQAEAAGVIIETVKPDTFRQVIKTSGQIIASQGDEASVVATTSGIVSFANRSITPGAAIRAGESVVTISAQKLPEGDPIAKAKLAYETARKDFQRAEGLVKEQIISEKEFEQTRYRFEAAKMVYEAQSSNYGDGGVSVTSPLGGFVKHILVNQGDFVSVGQPIATVSQNKRLQLRAEVSENYFKNIQNVRSAHFKMAYDDTLYKLSDLNGRLLSFGKVSDGESFFIPITFEFDHVGNILPGSFSEVYLLSSPIENMITVPVSAITEEQGLHFLYLQLDEEGYRKQEVILGQNDGERVQILSGLKQGDRIVTQGVYQVKLAAISSVMPEGHIH